MSDKKVKSLELNKIIKEEVSEFVKKSKDQFKANDETFEKVNNEYNKSVELEEYPSFVPKNLKEITLDQTKKLVDWLVERPFKQLIRRQDTISRQIRASIRKGDMNEQNSLRIMDAILDKAASVKNRNVWKQKISKVDGLKDDKKKD